LHHLDTVQIKVVVMLFKECTCCNRRWLTRLEFLTDPNLKLVGYQVNFEVLELGYFLFNHDSCGSTIAIHADLFQDLYNGPVFKVRKTHTNDCNAHCLHQNDLEPCPALCECAYVREILQVVRNWPKTSIQSMETTRTVQIGNLL